MERKPASGRKREKMTRRHVVKTALVKVGMSMLKLSLRKPQGK